MASVAVIGCVPVLGLMLELQHRRPPTSTSVRSDWTAPDGRGIRDLAHLHWFILAAFPRRVMNFVHPSMATPF